jgi:mannose-6-phosphate isomerase-like protein (cupin superfamily)
MLELTTRRASRVDAGCGRSEERRSPNDDYVVELDLRFPPLKRGDVPALVHAATDQWFSHRLCRVKGSVAPMGSAHGEADWHVHELEDEFLFSIEGEFLIDFHDRTVELAERRGFVIPKGVAHRTRPRQLPGRRRSGAAGVRQRLMILRTSIR